MRRSHASLHIAGCIIDILMESFSDLPALLGERYGRFQAPAMHEDLWLDMDLSCRARNPEPGEDPGTPSVERARRGTFIRRNDFMAELRFLGDRRFRLRGQLCDRVFAFDAMLRTVLAEMLAHYRGFLAHGCSLKFGDGGALFHGVSGSGKSTLARLAGVDSALTDEISILRQRDGGWRLYGTPFSGDFTECGRPAELPLRLLARFVEPKNRELNAPAAPGAMAFTLTRNIVSFSRSRHTNTVLLQLAVDAARQTPILDFAFRSGETWAGIEQRLQRALQPA